VANELNLVYRWALRWSRLGIALTLVLVLGFLALGREINLNIQLVIALVALLVGIPHGAIDHLIAIPNNPKSKFLAYIFVYVLIAVLAGFIIATWNINGFRAILLMSALHFGFGDASFRNEMLDVSSLKREKLGTEIMYAFPAGFLPVFLPITDSRTESALKRIHPELVNWGGGVEQQIRLLVIIITVIFLIIFAIQRKTNLVIDLLLLTGISFFAPPLIAFASYFGFWHAIRHTARLVPKLDSANKFALEGRSQKAIWSAVFPGLYAVAGSLLIAFGLMHFWPEKFSSSLLWSTLLIIWSLTVPHMITTARFDLKALD
jgi:Brp/Blh family beta-carotene 15,15'-monooxygenase